MPQPITILDGPVGTELLRHGIDLSGRRWSARALIDHADTVAEIHAAYAGAGATVHTANTFRTKRRDLAEPAPPHADWKALTRRAVEIARVSIPSHHTLAGGLSPLEDCYEPDRSPGESARPEHREFAEALVEAGVDLILCETFPAIPEALVALEEGLAAGAPGGIPVWLSFTPGPRAELLSSADVARGAREAAERGAGAVLVNCLAASRALAYVRALADGVGDRLPIGVYANAGEDHERIGWGVIGEEGPARYAELARTWIDAGATIVGGCCGTHPAHIRALARLLTT